MKHEPWLAGYCNKWPMKWGVTISEGKNESRYLKLKVSYLSLEKNLQNNQNMINCCNSKVVFVEKCFCLKFLLEKNLIDVLSLILKNVFIGWKIFLIRGGSRVSKAISPPKKPSKEASKVVLRPLVLESESAKKKKTINLFLLCSL